MLRIVSLFILFSMTLPFRVKGQEPASRLRISSPDFINEGEIPSRFTCDGEDVNPSLVIHGLPEGTKSLVLIVEDPDVVATTFNQWVVWNIKPTGAIDENSIPGIQGMNSIGNDHYQGPCPPAGKHRYHFRVYALNRELGIKAKSKRNLVEAAMKGHILAEGLLIGEYERKTFQLTENN